MKTSVKHILRHRECSFAAVLTSLLLLGGACSSDDVNHAFDKEIPVAFTTGIESVALPATQSLQDGKLTPGAVGNYQVGYQSPQLGRGRDSHVTLNISELY